MNSQLKISVVMATYNRANILHKTISHLVNQKLDAALYEVIIVDDASTDNTRQVVEEELQGVPFHMKYLHHPNNKGPGYTQNRGIREARANIVLLMADDVFLTDDVLKAHLDTHTQNPEDEAACLGRVLQSPDLNQSVFLKNWAPFRFSDLSNCKDLPYYMFWACNISFKREFILKYGMFRDNMGVRFGLQGAAHEDAELGYRLYQHNLKIYYNQDALAYHCHIETLKGTIRRSYERGLCWRGFYELVQQPELCIRYRNYNLITLFKNIYALKGPRQKYLLGQDRSIAMLIFRYLIRIIIFNKLTIPCIWLPILNYAEHNTILAECMHDKYYRGVILYYFLKGCREEKNILNYTRTEKYNYKISFIGNDNHQEIKKEETPIKQN